MRLLERFIINDDAEGDVRFPDERPLQFIVGAQLDVCNGFQGFGQVERGAKAIVTVSNYNGVGVIHTKTLVRLRLRLRLKMLLRLGFR